MRVTIQYLYSTDHKELLLPYAVQKVDKVEPGDLVVNNLREIQECNQSTCIFFNEKVIGRVNQGVHVIEGEEVDIVWDCKAAEKCGYPWCSGWCPGSEKQFRVQGKEKRKY